MSASRPHPSTMVEPQQLSVDIAGVGFGPAMGGFYMQPPATAATPV